MATINLLPEELRRKEESELKRSSKKRKIVFEMNLPDKTSKKAIVDDKKPSFFKRIFGTPNLPYSDNYRAGSGETKIKPSNSNKPNNQNPVWSKSVSYKTEPITYGGGTNKVESEIKVNPSFGKNFIDQSAELNKNKNYPKETIAFQKAVPQNNFAKIESVKPELDLKFQTKTKKEKDNGWFKIFSSLFFPNKREIQTNFIKTGNIEQIKKEISNELRQDKYNHSISKGKAKKSHKNKLNGQYHLAPKEENSGFDINLIPQELIFQTQPNPLAKIASLLLVILIGIFIVVGGYYYMNMKQQQLHEQITQKQNENLAIIKELAGYKKIEEENTFISKKITAISKLLENHIYWTNFYVMLEKYTLPGVYYTSFGADTSGVISLPVIATDYQTALKQVTLLTQATDFVKEAKVNSMQMSADEKKGTSAINFEIKLILNRDIFNKKTNGQRN